MAYEILSPCNVTRGYGIMISPGDSTLQYGYDKWESVSAVLLWGLADSMSDIISCCVK